jgi:hypothetical protein
MIENDASEYNVENAKMSIIKSLEFINLNKMRKKFEQNITVNLFTKL